ncbi:hypothetical protein RJT34_18792 [Clitoria ternatea]|uniref:Uncharacterized protein n=1 Tax=Clitoria ternatea TaxID=43366 RepID=A0AAN9PEN8_CLITE
MTEGGMFSVFFIFGFVLVSNQVVSFWNTFTSSFSFLADHLLFRVHPFFVLLANRLSILMWVSHHILYSVKLFCNVNQVLIFLILENTRKKSRKKMVKEKVELEFV